MPVVEEPRVRRGRLFGRRRAPEPEPAIAAAVDEVVESSVVEEPAVDELVVDVVVEDAVVDEPVVDELVDDSAIEEIVADAAVGPVVEVAEGESLLTPEAVEPRARR